MRDSAKILRVMFLVGLVVWTVGVMLYCSYAFYVYGGPYPDSSDYELLSSLYGIVTLGFVILFISIGFTVFKAREILLAEKRGRMLGLAFVVLGAILRLVHYILFYSPFREWRYWDLDFTIPMSMLVSNIGMLLIGAGLGLLVFGTVAIQGEKQDEDDPIQS
ncbi:MAG: hypothetical protein LN417_02150 [Candidatus Thermoplasmatota archaeon]|nr:hypothetical protein [Candidatus Thermoplasmatota archaeon]